MTLDDILIKGANKVVRAANWTLGMTRAQTATAVEILGIGLGAYAAFKANEPQLMTACAPISGYSSFKLHKRYAEIDALESNLPLGTMSMDAERKKENTLTVSKIVDIPFGTTMALIHGSIEKDKVRFPDHFEAVSIYCVSTVAAAYIMNADYVKPQKNCLARASDYLSQKIKDFAPTPEPALAKF